MAYQGLPPKNSRPHTLPTPPPPKRKGTVEAPVAKRGVDNSDNTDGLFWLWALFG